LIQYSYANEKCSIEFDYDYIELHWEAFKTPKKIGVKGRFKELGLNKKEFRGKDFKSILEGQSFKVNAASIRSRKPLRDANITKYFFLNMSGGLFLVGQITKLDKENNKLHVDLTFNKVTKKVVLDIIVTNTKWKASGVIDVLEFGMNKALSTLNKACFKKHQGKTWSDVKVDLVIWYSKEC
jgi:polyisoprenoid-binding protein YceI